MEQQRTLRSQNYRYQPRETIVRQHFKQQAGQKQPAPAQRGRQEAPPTRKAGNSSVQHRTSRELRPAHARSHSSGVAKRFRDQPRSNPLPSSEARQSRNSGSSRGLHRVCSRRQSRKARYKDRSHSSEARQYRVSDSSRGLHRVCSRRQSRKARYKDRSHSSEARQ